MERPQFVILGADHAGFRLKQRIRRLLEYWMVALEDVGVFTDEVPADYPVVALRVAERVITHPSYTGVLICGTGIGMSIAANKVPGIRAAVCHDPLTVRMARQHNAANVLCIGSRVVGNMPDDQLAFLLRIWLETPFEGGRHRRRLERIHVYEQQLQGVPARTR